MIQASSREGDWILDFFAGSGATGAVAQSLGRRFVLVDSNEESGGRHASTPPGRDVPGRAPPLDEIAGEAGRGRDGGLSPGVRVTLRQSVRASGRQASERQSVRASERRPSGGGLLGVRLAARDVHPADRDRAPDECDELLVAERLELLGAHQEIPAAVATAATRLAITCRPRRRR
nr:hypothetical protein GCM10025699_77760 [Microbacterium flavescens]